MSRDEKAYIRNPKGEQLSRISDQDLEDFEQEKRIQQWLEREGKSESVDFKHINRKGRARNTLLKAQRLDGPYGKDGTRTLADIIQGSDGRDLECRGDSDEPLERSETDRLNQDIDVFFEAIGITERTKTWAIKTLKSAESLRNLRSLMKDDEQSETSLINSEWETL